ncbi:MAG: hypothetical protein HYY97_15955 [Rhodocyclales bacterium]|nr:hypothetical protein [Rhodocyclales bacterium]
MTWVTIFDDMPREEIARELEEFGDELHKRHAEIMRRARSARCAGNLKRYATLRRKAEPYGKMLWNLMSRFPPF